MPLRLPAFDAHERVREIAFALILTESRPVSPDELTVASGGSDIATILDALAASGWIDRAEDGRVTGSAGLSLSDGPHHLEIGDRSFRTWCAYDALGIPAALGVAAAIETACGECDAPISLSVIGGRPTRTGPEQLWLAAGQGDLRTSFCTPTVLLCGTAHGAAWAKRQDDNGKLMTLDEAAALGTAAWAACAAAAHLVAAGEVEYVGGPRDTQRERRVDAPERIAESNGHYLRSVRCADDGALRYVWRESTAKN
jgi:alkylmercury lyase